MHNRYEYDYIWAKYLSARLAQSINSDEDPGNVLGSQLEDRGKIYTTLLDNYSTITHARNILKEIHKWLFFWGVAAVGVTVTILGSQIVQKVLAIENEPNGLFLICSLVPRRILTARPYCCIAWRGALISLTFSIS